MSNRRRVLFHGLAVVIAVCTTNSACGQDDPPPMTWNDLMKCDLVVVGRYNDHSDRRLALEVTTVLRGKTCKSGDVLQVALAPRFTVKAGRPLRRDKSARANAHLNYKFPGAPHESTHFGNMARPAIWFFPKAKTLALTQRGQIQPDFRKGWQAALSGKKPNLFFRLITRFDGVQRAQAVEELFRTHDQATLERLLDWRLAPTPMSALSNRDFVDRILLNIGDKNGKYYGAVKKRLHARAEYNDRWLKAMLCRYMARADGKRAIVDFRRILKERKIFGSRWGAIELENEEGLKFLLDALRDPKTASEALNCLRSLLRGDQRDVQSAVAVARLQEIAYPQIRKIMQSGVLPKDVQGFAEFRSYFGFLHGHWSVPRGSVPNSYGPHTSEFIRYGRKLHRLHQFGQWQRNADWNRIMYADVAYGKSSLAKVLDGNQNKWIYAVAVAYGFEKYRKHLIAAQRVTASATSDDSSFIRPLLWDAAYRKQYLKYLDAQTAKPATAGTTHMWLSLRPLFPQYPREYFQRGVDWPNSQNRPTSGQHLLKTKLHWDLDVNYKDPAPVVRRQKERARRILKRIIADDMVHVRANVLREFGVKLKGQPSSAWIPVLRKTALRPHPTIRFNALHLLGMLVGDDGLRGYPIDALKTPWLEKMLNDFFAKRDRRFKRIMPEKEFKKLWDQLGVKETAIAQGAMRRLIEHPTTTFKYVSSELRPNKRAKISPAHQKLIDNLSSKSFRVRTDAAKKLKRLGRKVHPHLVAALKKPQSLEMAMRIRKIIKPKRWSAEHMQVIRAVDVLQNLGVPEVEPLLAELARGPDVLPVTEEAKNALQRRYMQFRW